MSILYGRLLSLCESKGVTGYRMAKDTGVSASLMTDLKMGRKKSVSAEVAEKLASYFNVSVGYLLGTDQKENPLAVSSEGLTDEEKRFLEKFRAASEDKRLAAEYVLGLK